MVSACSNETGSKLFEMREIQQNEIKTSVLLMDTMFRRISRIAGRSCKVRKLLVI
jgi:hypothetical protein